jgi:hypothetical protein
VSRYLLLPVNYTSEEKRLDSDNDDDDDDPPNTQDVFTEEFKGQCFDNDFLLPASLNVDDYRALSFKAEQMMKLQKDQINETFKNLVKDHESEIVRTCRSTVVGGGSGSGGGGMTTLTSSQITTATMTLLGSKIKRQSERTETRIAEDMRKMKELSFFVHWRIRGAEAVHVNEVFGFWVHVNLLLFLMRSCRKMVVFSRYLSQMFRNAIPYIYLVEKNYYNREDVRKILRSYYRRFDLKYEFSFKNMKHTKEAEGVFHFDEYVREDRGSSKSHFDVFYEKLLNSASVPTSGDKGEEEELWVLGAETKTTTTALKRKADKVLRFIETLKRRGVIRNASALRELIKGGGRGRRYRASRLLEKYKIVFATFGTLKDFFDTCRVATGSSSSSSSSSSSRGVGLGSTGEILNFKDSVYSILPMLNLIERLPSVKDSALENDHYLDLMICYPRSPSRGAHPLYSTLLSRNDLFKILCGNTQRNGRKGDDCYHGYSESDSEDDDDDDDYDEEDGGTGAEELLALRRKAEENMILKIISQVIPQRGQIRDFDKNVKRFYLRSQAFARFIDDVIVNTLCGAYLPYPNINEIFAESPYKTLKVLLSFYRKFAKYEREYAALVRGRGKSRGLKIRRKKFKFIKENFLGNGFIRHALKELVVFLMLKEYEQVKKVVTWEMFNAATKIKLDLTLENFVYCSIYNANLVRKLFLKNNRMARGLPSDSRQFLDTRRKNKTPCLISSIKEALILLKEEDFFVRTLVLQGFPETFNYFLLKRDVGEDVEEKITRFWSFFNLEVMKDSRNHGWGLYLKGVFKGLTSGDVYIYRSIFNYQKMFINNEALKSNLSKLTRLGRTVLFYLVTIHKKLNFLRVYPLSSQESLFQRLVERFSKHGKFSDFYVSYCCKNNLCSKGKGSKAKKKKKSKSNDDSSGNDEDYHHNHNHDDDDDDYYYYYKTTTCPVNILPAGFFCFHKDTHPSIKDEPVPDPIPGRDEGSKKKRICPKRRYGFYRRKALDSGLIKNLVVVDLFSNNKTMFERYKKGILSDLEKYDDDDDGQGMGGNLQNITTTNGETRVRTGGEKKKKKRIYFIDLLSKPQRDQLRGRSRLWKKETGGNGSTKSRRGRFEWPRFADAAGYKRQLLKNFYKFKKIVCFIRKMCKWITSENVTINDRKIHFYPAVGYLYEVRNIKSKESIYYKLCVHCTKVKRLNLSTCFGGRERFQYYEYKCKQCSKLYREYEREDYERVMLIDTSVDYDVFSCVTK